MAFVGYLKNLPCFTCTVNNKFNSYIKTWEHQRDFDANTGTSNPKVITLNNNK